MRADCLTQPNTWADPTWERGKTQARSGSSQGFVGGTIESHLDRTFRVRQSAIKKGAPRGVIGSVRPKNKRCLVSASSTTAVASYTGARG
jgi:hypothetical protein